MGRVALAFLLGACCIHCLPRLPDWHGARRLARCRRSRWRASVDSSSSRALLAGLGWAWLSAAGRTAGDLPPALEGQDLLVRGYVASFPRAAAGDSQFLLDVARAAQPASRRGFASSGIAPRVRRRPASCGNWSCGSSVATDSRIPAASTTKRSCFAKASARPAMCATTSATRGLRRRSLRYAVTRARGWISGRIRAGGARSARARRSARSRGRRHAGDDAGAMARVRCDRDDASDGDLGLAHQHGRGTGRVARRRDRAAAVGAGAPLERDAWPSDRRHGGGVRVFDARRDCRCRRSARC